VRFYESAPSSTPSSRVRHAALAGARNRAEADDFILPLFVSEKITSRVPVASMPGVFQLSLDELVTEAKQAHAVGVASVLLFGIPSVKTNARRKLTRRTASCSAPSAN
jgi:delta-aminolevulinic acid dehydratase/porphobilinogen synthase